MIAPEDRPEPDRTDGAPHPRETGRLVGQAAAEAAFLDACRAGRLHHAWLLIGPRGAGKATLAWRMARFLLAGAAGDAGDAGLLTDTAAAVPDTLDIPPDHPVSRRVTALSEPGLFLLRRAWDDKANRLKTVITVDEVRRLKGFLSLSATDGGRRVVIIDAADEMNNATANAVLKMLEEPPPGVVLILVSHRPSALLPTIRSRCRTLRLEALTAEDMASALAGLGVETAANSAALAELAGGSVGEAVRLVNLDGIGVYTMLTGLFSTLPGLDRRKLLELADGVTGKTARIRPDVALDMLDALLVRLARCGARGGPPDEAVPGEAALLSRLSPTPAAGRAWADLQQELSSRARHGVAVNIDPAALILDIGFRIDRTAAQLAA